MNALLAHKRDLLPEEVISYDDDGFLHSFNDEPAVIRRGSGKEWYYHGLLHRENNLPAIHRFDGSKRWLQNGLTHRDKDLPAVIWKNSGVKEWYYEGEEHRVCGPSESTFRPWKILGVFYI